MFMPHSTLTWSGMDSESGSEKKSDGSEPNVSTPEHEGNSLTYELYECQTCSATVLGAHDDTAELSCHGEPMVPVDDTGIGHAEPDLEELFTQIYGLPRETVDVCHFVFENGTASVSETAERFGYDPETVSSVLSRLAEAGFLDKQKLSLGTVEDETDGDGEVEVYEAGDVEETHRAETVGFLRWAAEAGEVLEKANRVKRRCLEDGDYELDETFWEIYHKRV